MDQIPDTKPGNYYVSAINGTRKTLLAGPFKRHETALALLEVARNIAIEIDPYAHFWDFGTARTPETFNELGTLNRNGLL